MASGMNQIDSFARGVTVRLIDEGLDVPGRDGGRYGERRRWVAGLTVSGGDVQSSAGVRR